MSSALCATDKNEFNRIKRSIIRRLARPSQGLRVIIEELDLQDLLGPDLTSIIDYLAYTDEFYIRMIVNSAHHAEKKAYRRQQMIRRAVHALRKEGKILIDGHVVHPSVRPSGRSRNDSRRPKRKKKFDMRPYHGRPGRDRRRLPQFVAA